MRSGVNLEGTFTLKPFLTRGTEIVSNFVDLFSVGCYHVPLFKLPTTHALWKSLFWRVYHASMLIGIINGVECFHANGARMTPSLTSGTKSIIHAMVVEPFDTFETFFT